jgi:hypothetical protein
MANGVGMAFKSLFFIKNVPGWERALRVISGGAVAAIAGLQGGPLSVAGVATGVVFALTGFFGFCPMCAMIGRKLKSET